MVRLALILMLLFCTGCGQGSGPPVEIVVRNGFTGPIWIMLDAKGQDIPLVKGRYQILIPADGVLRVRSFGPFNQWHRSYARYEDGYCATSGLG